MTRQDEEVLLEFHQIGAVVKVSAVDPATLTAVMWATGVSVPVRPT